MSELALRSSSSSMWALSEAGVSPRGGKGKGRRLLGKGQGLHLDLRHGRRSPRVCPSKTVTRPARLSSAGSLS